MKLINYKGVELENVDIEGASKTKIRWLVAQKDGAPNFALRMFEVEPGGNTPYHIHDWEHEVFVLEGEGILKFEEEEIPFKEWDVIYVDPNKHHQFKNTGDKKMRFLCIVPHSPVSKSAKKDFVNPFAGGKANNC